MLKVSSSYKAYKFKGMALIASITLCAQSLAKTCREVPLLSNSDTLHTIQACFCKLVLTLLAQRNGTQKKTNLPVK